MSRIILKKPGLFATEACLPSAQAGSETPLDNPRRICIHRGKLSHGETQSIEKNMNQNVFYFPGWGIKGDVLLFSEFSYI